MQPILEKEILNSSNIRVEFAGFVDPVELPKYYAASDLYIHPSKVDPHPLAISEAIYMDCPIIVSDRCGSYGENDDVQNGKNGFIYKWGDIYGLSELIERFAKNKGLRITFGEVSHKIAVESQEKAHLSGFKKALLENNLLVENYSNKD